MSPIYGSTLEGAEEKYEVKSELVRLLRFVQTPLGTLTLIGTQEWVEQLLWPGEPKALEGINCTGSSAALAEAEIQLLEYFSGNRRRFHVPLAPRGTLFQKQVWLEISKIPFGKTQTYSSLAKRLGDPKKARAVGGALSKNPIPIFLPCHRVLCAQGNLGGFSGGAKTKCFLLAMEC